MAAADKATSRSEGEQRLAAPSISLPKGGGAIRGIGEKFAANPVTGTGSMTVPLAASPGRAGFGPQLALSYDSGAGNGPFGFGWSLSLPSITRKTDKGLPQYLDADESDVFILSGAEDLVPELRPDGSRFEDQETVPGYTIHRYRPRIEGLFARIERWTHQADGDVHWRSISKDNILTLYGYDKDDNDNARIADPIDPSRVFSWLMCETRDDKGNAVIYEYKPEDGTGVALTQAHEHNRGERNSPLRQVNRYIKHIRYGNRNSLLTAEGLRPRFLTEAMLQQADWMFEVVFDYGEHHLDDPRPDDAGEWLCRNDPFSSYRAGFEVRTYRLCQRVLMFHHFPGEAGVGADCMVRSTDFVYRDIRNHPDDRRQGHPIASFIAAVTQSGYTRAEAGGYLKKSLPPLEFEYSDAVIGQEVHDVDPASLENLPYGVDGSAYQWVDLDGEGLSGVLTEQGGGWFYKRNESALTRDAATEGYTARFAPVEQVARIPAGSLLTGGHGQVDVVEFERPVAGFYERTDEQDWEPFRAFRSLPNLAWNDPNLKFIDLTGDGHADVLITEDQAFTWYPSLAEEGFGAATRISVPTDEERGPYVVFADGTQTISLADLSGDGLTDIVRIRNGEVCYWPNLGYGRFGAKVTMDDAPWFDTPEQFDPRRLRLADIDGSGVTDIIYLGRNRTRFWFNQSGNAWSQTNELPGFPPVDNVASVAAVDLLGNGTACLVWSSPLPGASRAPMQYLNLMAEGKPHLLVRTVNNLGAETRVHYAPSTSCYLQDKYAGKPWITKLPFPVHVVERVETYDHISRNHFVTRYAYHHGYFDGEEREFRGFGMVEQFDTEAFAALTADGTLPAATNVDAASHVPPVLTKTWFHTGIYFGRDRVSTFFAGLLDTSDRGEYYREPAWRDDDGEAKKRLLDDTILPAGLTVEEEREACRALKGAMLRQEVYALDGTGTEDYPDGHPYTVTEQNFSIRALQQRGDNRHAVFFTHAREAISYHYERNPTDPRITHALTLEVEDFGNVLKAAAVGYGRRQADANLPLQADRDKQAHTRVTYTENLVTNAIKADDDYRTPLPCETRTYELTGYMPTGTAERFQHDDFVQPDPGDPEGLRQTLIFDNEIPYEANPTNGKQRRLIEHVRTLYRPDDLGEAQANPLALLPLRTVEALALPGESYKLAFTPGLLAKVYQRPLDVVQPPGSPGPENLLPTLAHVLGGQGADQGGYVDLDNNGRWWIPAGRVFLSPNSGDMSAPELTHARQHFFLPHRFRDPFGNETTVAYDSNASDPSRNHNLLIVETRDPLGNVVTVETTDNNGQAAIRNDYRVLQPSWVTDPNGNRTRVAFDALGMVVGTAMMGKPLQAPVKGDSLEPEAFQADLTQAQIDGFYDVEDPHVPAPNLLKDATTRIIYDLDRFHRTQQAHPEDPTLWLPVYAATLARETHASDPLPPEGLKIQISFSYSDGFGREIQKKIQAEPGPVIEGGPVVSPRWVGSGWTIFNNKGKPVRQYEPFFSQLPEKRHRFEFGMQVGVSPILFYDPVERVVATLHPNHTWEKVVFDPWQQTTYDVNDTVLNADGSTDPKLDQDVTGFFSRLPDADYIPTWYEQRRVLVANDPERVAAEKAAVHRQTPTVAHLDTLGRTFLTIAHNRFERNNVIVEEKYPTRVELDIEGNQRAVRDAIVQNGAQQGRLVMRYDYDMLGNRIHQASMEAGEHWTLGDVTGKPIRAWDSRGFLRHITYDALRRPTETFVTENDVARLDARMVYGEALGDADNHRTRVFQVFDGAGVVTSEAYDFKGNLLRGRRDLLPNYQQAVDWQQNPVPNDGTFPSSTTYDALNRPTDVTAPDNSIYRPTYNEANLLDKVGVNLRGAVAPTPFVTNINYDAKGQRELIAYGNGAQTHYEYDPLTFRLTRLRTTRPVGLNGLDSQLFTDPAVVQDLRYTYDPVGNITRIEDAALQTIVHNNEPVQPVCAYTYDAIYRLIEAQGREHIGQTAHDFDPPDGNRRDFDFAGLADFIAHPNDMQAMRNYTERYEYDPVGNFQFMRHSANGGSWTRGYEYDAASLIEPAKQSNRLTKTTVGNGLNFVETYTYKDAQGNDVQGCITAINSMKMAWDSQDQLQQVDLGGGGTAYYVYDGGGQRVRKVIETLNGTRKQERIYLGGFEIYREYENDGDTVTLERETLHVMDDKQRIALVETRTRGTDGSLAQLIRYQFGNHLGSASLQLDDQAQIISYEEYSPYGNISYQAVRSQTETPTRYRYTGMERDEESGLSYHGARYYAPWLGRWVSPDPLGFSNDGTNAYSYVRNNPTNYVDPTGFEGEESLTVRTDIDCKAKARDCVTLFQNTFNGGTNWEGTFVPTEFEQSLRSWDKDYFPIVRDGAIGIDGLVGWRRVDISDAHGDGTRYTDFTRDGTQVGDSGFVSGSGSMTPGFGASLLNPMDWVGGVFASKLVSGGKAVYGAIAAKFGAKKAVTTEAATATDQLAATVARTLSKKEAGPVVATASSKETGAFSSKLNQAEHEELPALLQERVDASDALSRSINSPAEILKYQKTSGIYNHADVNAVGAQWNAIEAKLGRSITLEEARKMITLDVVSRSTGLGVPLCSRCSLILEGFQTTARVEKAFEQQMLKLWNGLHPPGKPI